MLSTYVTGFLLVWCQINARSATKIQCDLTRFIDRFLSNQTEWDGTENAPIVSLANTIQTEKSSRNLIRSNRNQNWLIWNQTNVYLDQNQSENGKYNLISGWFNKISKMFLCLHTLLFIIINTINIYFLLSLTPLIFIYYH